MVPQEDLKEESRIGGYLIKFKTKKCPVLGGGISYVLLSMGTNIAICQTFSQGLLILGLLRRLF